jgi:hypothetical protein
MDDQRHAGQCARQQDRTRAILTVLLLCLLLPGCGLLGDEGQGAVSSGPPPTRTAAARPRSSRSPTTASGTSPTTAAAQGTPLERCVQAAFGLHPSFEESGPLGPQRATQLDLPPAWRTTLVEPQPPARSVVYGITLDGGIALAQLVQASAPDQAADDVVVCYMQVGSVHGSAETADDALALLLATFPGVARDPASYTLTTTADGFTFGQRDEHAHMQLATYRHPAGRLILGAWYELLSPNTTVVIGHFYAQRFKGRRYDSRLAQALISLTTTVVLRHVSKGAGSA